MQVRQLSVKYFFDEGAILDEAELTPIFHAWIRDKRLAGGLLVDVADYRHVPSGPGVMIVGHEEHYYVDSMGGERGMRYRRKRDPLGDPAAKLGEAFRRVLAAAHALEAEPSLGGNACFRTDRVLVEVVSRLDAGNDDATEAALAPAIAAFVGDLYGGAEVSVKRRGDERDCFGVELSISGATPPLAELAARLA